MIVICEECGKKYKIDPDKISGKGARFKCKSCNHVITVSKPQDKPQEPPTPPHVEKPVARQDEKRPPAPEPEKEEGPTGKKAGKRSGRKMKMFGVRGKMIVLFLIVPIVFMVAAGALYVLQLEELSTLIIDESSKLVTQMAEESIAGTSRAVSRECMIYLSNRKGLKKEDFNNNEDFRKTAVQKVGKKGYTALYEIPGPDGVWRTWAHDNPKIIGIDMSKLRKPLKSNFPGFWRVYTGVKGGKESKGYYTWKDKDGSIRDKFMVCTPVPGTSYIIAATTYLDEFTMPMRTTEARAKEQTERTKRVVFFILGGTIILIGVIVSLYGYGLTRKIKHLTETADRISVGELETEIGVKSKDEIGDLADAIARMQESIRLSMERLRRRR